MIHYLTERRPTWRALTAFAFLGAVIAWIVFIFIPSSPRTIIFHAFVPSSHFDPQGMTVQYIGDPSSHWLSSWDMPASRQILRPHRSSILAYECGPLREIDRLATSLTASGQAVLNPRPERLPRPNSLGFPSGVPPVIAIVTGKTLSSDSDAYDPPHVGASYIGTSSVTLTLRRSLIESPVPGLPVYQIFLFADAGGGVFDVAAPYTTSRSVVVDDDIILDVSVDPADRSHNSWQCIGVSLEGGGTPQRDLHFPEPNPLDLSSHSEVIFELLEHYDSPNLPAPFGMYIYASHIRINRVPEGTLSIGATVRHVSRFSEVDASGSLRIELRQRDGAFTIEGLSTSFRVNGEELATTKRFDLQNTLLMVVTFIVVTVGASVLTEVVRRAMQPNSAPSD